MKTAKMISENTRTNKTYDWHLKIDHINEKNLIKMAKEELMNCNR